jgi:hypothetical protein
MKRFFGFLINTKPGLIISAGLIFIASQAYNLPATEYIRHTSDAVSTDVALRLVYFTLMCLVAFAETLLLDELLFHGGWRRRVLGGRRKRGSAVEEKAADGDAADGDAADRDAADGDAADGDTVDGDVVDRDAADGDTVDGDVVDRDAADGDAADRNTGDGDAVDGDTVDGDPSMMASLFKDYTVHVTLLFLGLLAANYFLFNAINGQFDSYYRKVGHLYTQLRSPQLETRISAMAELTPKRVASVSSKLLDRLEHGDEREKVWAAWGLGYRAEYGLLDSSLRQEAESRILPLVKKGPERQRAVAAVALARLESYRWLEEAIAALRTDAPDPMFAVALGLLRDHRPDALTALTGMLADKGEKRAMAAAWALGQMKVKTAAVPLRDKLFDLPGPVQCVAVESLGRLGDVKSVPLLTRLFESKESHLICPQKGIKLRPDADGDRFYLFYWRSAVYKKLHCTNKREPLRVRILKVLWRIGDTRILPWMRKMAQSGMLAPRAKACAIRVYNRAVVAEK